MYINRLKYYRIKYISEYDPLTKTLNRRTGYRKITDLITKANKHNTPFSLCFIDVNGLKLVNDNLGHDMGGNLLKNVTDCIKLNIRDKDFIIRLGGDEFLIILDGINKSDSEKVWTRIKACYNEINKENNYPYLISVSHGIVQYNKKFNSKINTLIQKTAKLNLVVFSNTKPFFIVSTFNVSKGTVKKTLKNVIQLIYAI